MLFLSELMKTWECLCLTTLASVSLATTGTAFEIIIRYDLDTEGFFDQPGAQDAMETATQFYENLIVDQLEAIDPNNFLPGTQLRWRPTYNEPNANGATLNAVSQTDLVVPANSIIIFPAGRTLSTTAQAGPGGIEFLTPVNSAWFSQLVGRNEPGAIIFQGNGFSSNPTDFAPWGGALFFDDNRTWNFSTTDANANVGTDFLSVALHELGHILGLGNNNPASSWLSAVDNGRFQGPFATSSNNNQAPLLDPLLTHWANSLPQNQTIELFGRQHGELQTPLMNESTGTTTTSVFTVPTDLEIASLRDIGWELVASPTPLQLSLEDFDPIAPAVNIPTTTGTRYQIMRSDSLATFTPSGPEIIGDGSVQTWLDPEGNTERAFYRIELSSNFSIATKNTRQLQPYPQKKSPPALISTDLPLPSLSPSQCECEFHDR